MHSTIEFKRFGPCCSVSKVKSVSFAQSAAVCFLEQRLLRQGETGKTDAIRTLTDLVSGTQFISLINGKDGKGSGSQKPSSPRSWTLMHLKSQLKLLDCQG